MLKPNDDLFLKLTRNSLPPLSSTFAITLLLISDTLAILGTAYLTYDLIVVYSLVGNLYLFAVVFVWLVALSLLNFSGLYQFNVALYPMRRVSYILAAVAVAYLFLLAAAFSLKVTDSFSRLWVASFILCTIITLTVFRLILAMILRRLLSDKNLKRNLAVIGDSEQARRLTASMKEMPSCPVRICGIFTDAPRTESDGDDSVAGLDTAIDLARQGHIDDVAIALPWSQEERIMGLIERMRELPVNVYLVSDLIGFRANFRAAPSHFGSLPIVEVVGKPLSGWDSVIKAAEDYVLGMIILIAVLPVLAVIAIAIRLDSPGPIVFRQRRLGFNNQVFTVYKFRTMYHEAVPASRTVQATEGDPRVTRVGRLLRRWSLDELPQIFNVINGTMSLVGPRPHALDHNEDFAQRMKGYFGRHRVKPGITGLAQVKGYRGETDTHEKLEGRIRNDIYYAENWSPSLDLRILVKTAVVCVFGKNAY